jgi:hypothetical protein
MQVQPQPDHLVPFRWPSDWSDPSLVRHLAGGPVNCVVLDSANPQVAAAAEKAGLTVRLRSSLAGPSSPVVLTGLVWPRIAPMKNDTTESGPTGAPWIDSNCWVTRLARVRSPGKPIWLDFAPPEGDAPPESAYRVAVADTMASGAQWLVTLHPATAKGLQAGAADAARALQGLLGALAFFAKRREWLSYEPDAALGVLSTFAGKNEYMGSEVLNLSARRNLQYRILDRAEQAEPKLTGLKALLYVDEERPSGKWKATLTAFCRGGGMLIVPPALAADFPGGQPVHCPVAGYHFVPFGKGRVAVAAQAWDDPYFLAADVHNLVGVRNDPALLFNSGSLWQHYSKAVNGQAALLQLVGFTGRNNSSVSVRFAHETRSALWHVPGTDAPAPMKPVAVDGHMEYQLPPFSYYGALEVRL